MTKKRALAKVPPKKAGRHGRRPAKERLQALGRKVDRKAEDVLERCLDHAEANIDRWLDRAADHLLAGIGLKPPERVQVRDGKGEMIDLVRQPDGTYAPWRAGA